jgi:hypothetical protein
MKHKPESWNGATLSSDSASSSVRRSLTRAGLQLGQLSHVVSGALSNLQGGSSPRGAAQNRMRALLNQDRALLSHRACGAASLESDDELGVPELPLKGGPTRTAAQNRMRELLNQDRAMLALREARRRDDPGSEPLDDDFAAELVQQVEREWTLVDQVDQVDAVHQAEVTSFASTVLAEPSVSRGKCVGVTASFVAEPEVASVCTPGPVAVTAAPIEPVVISKPVFVAPTVVPKPPAPSPRPGQDSEGGGGDPIRTRGMAKLLALQGYKDRALSIYDELIAEEPNNAALRAEADRLRN